MTQERAVELFLGRMVKSINSQKKQVQDDRLASYTYPYSVWRFKCVGMQLFCPANRLFRLLCGIPHVASLRTLTHILDIILDLEEAVAGIGVSAEEFGRALSLAL